MSEEVSGGGSAISKERTEPHDHTVDLFVGAFNAPKATAANDHAFHECR